MDFECRGSMEKQYGGHHRMIIACDIDGVLNDLFPTVLALYNSRTHKNIQLSDISVYNLSECLPPEDAEGIHALFETKELWDSLKPLPGSQQGLETLIKKGHRVYLATSTHYKNFAWKIEWIQRYFPFISSHNVIRIMDKSLLNCDVMIDDHLDNLAGNFCERIVFDAPWNRSKSKEFAYDMHRAHNWKDVINIINKLERKCKEWEKK